MKKIINQGYFILLILALFYTKGVSQINPWYDIFPIDSCKFEEPCEWIITDTSQQNIWQIGTPSKQFFSSAYSEPFAILTDTIEPYRIMANSYFDIQMPIPYMNYVIGFRHKFQSDTLTDGGYIEISYDEGQSWHNVIFDDSISQPYEFNSENLYTSQDTLYNGKFGFSGSSNGWVHTQIQWIWAIVTKDIPESYILRFNFISDSIQTNKEGWMIDDIIISGTSSGSIEEENFNSISSTVYPNPFETLTTLKFENNRMDIFSLTVYDLFGKTVKSVTDISTGEVIIERGSLHEGVYIYHLKSGNDLQSTGKLIIMK